MKTQTPPQFIQPASMVRRGFTLVELLVVIGIIALLIGLLLPAIAAVSTAAKNSKTDSILTEFGKACEQFQLEHGFYPGLVPEQALAAAAAGGAAEISSTENALLHLMGGYMVDDGSPAYLAATGREYDFTAWNGPRFKVLSDPALPGRPSQMGRGPVINGKQYPPYYSPGNDEFAIARGQVGEPDFQIPDVLDAWGTPIIYLKRARTVGPIVGDPGDVPAPQFMRDGANSYLISTGLGELLGNQVPGGGTVQYSMLNASGGGASQNGNFTAAEWNLMVILGHQGLMTDVSGDIYYSQPRGEFAVISAGEDGIFFSQHEFDPTDTDNEIPSPAAVKEFDDIVRMGGGGG